PRIIATSTFLKTKALLNELLKKLQVLIQKETFTLSFAPPHVSKKVSIARNQKLNKNQTPTKLLPLNNSVPNAPKNSARELNTTTTPPKTTKKNSALKNASLI